MSHACLVFLAVLGPPGPTPFPYTTLFRSEATLEALTSTIVDVLDVDAALIRMPDERRDWVLPLALKVAEPRLERSEEHTSELQSHSDLVCRLLLEKKKVPIVMI